MKNSHPLIAFAMSGECGIIKLYRLTADFDARDVLTEYYVGISESRRPSRAERDLPQLETHQCTAISCRHMHSLVNSVAS